MDDCVDALIYRKRNDVWINGWMDRKNTDSIGTTSFLIYLLVRNTNICKKRCTHKFYILKTRICIYLLGNFKKLSDVILFDSLF